MVSTFLSVWTITTCRIVSRHGLRFQVPKSHDKAKHEPSKVPSKATMAIVSGFLDSIRHTYEPDGLESNSSKMTTQPFKKSGEFVKYQKIFTPNRWPASNKIELDVSSEEKMLWFDWSVNLWLKRTNETMYNGTQKTKVLEDDFPFQTGDFSGSSREFSGISINPHEVVPKSRRSAPFLRCSLKLWVASCGCHFRKLRKPQGMRLLSKCSLSCKRI